MSTSRKPRGRITLSQERMYDIVRFPVITEKATMVSEHNPRADERDEAGDSRRRRGPFRR